MATTTTSPATDDRSTKRMKPDEGPPEAAHAYPPSGPPPPPYGYPPPPYGYHAPPPPHHPHWQQPQSPPYRGDWNYGRKMRKKPDEPDYYNTAPPYYPQYPAYANQGTWTGKPDDYSRHSEDDGANSSTGGSKEKGRGSYKCGRVRLFYCCKNMYLTISQCGVPKKGHVCPYQPKLKRRPDEPPPETRNAAVQVEMDEFMTIRRLNLKLQGLPESYVAEPYELSEEPPAV